MQGLPDQAGEVLAFWFVESRPRLWCAKDTAFDALVLFSDHAAAITAGVQQITLAAAAAAGEQQLLEQQGLLGGEVQRVTVYLSHSLAGLERQRPPAQLALQG
jgi:hypothetical protein